MRYNPISLSNALALEPLIFFNRETFVYTQLQAYFAKHKSHIESDHHHHHHHLFRSEDLPPQWFKPVVMTLGNLICIVGLSCFLCVSLLCVGSHS